MTQPQLKIIARNIQDGTLGGAYIIEISKALNFTFLISGSGAFFFCDEIMDDMMDRWNKTKDTCAVLDCIRDWHDNPTMRNGTRCKIQAGLIEKVRNSA
jgi:hypothetical protein